MARKYTNPVLRWECPKAVANSSWLAPASNIRRAIESKVIANSPLARQCGRNGSNQRRGRLSAAVESEQEGVCRGVLELREERRQQWRPFAFYFPKQRQPRGLGVLLLDRAERQVHDGCATESRRGRRLWDISMPDEEGLKGAAEPLQVHLRQGIVQFAAEFFSVWVKRFDVPQFFSRYWWRGACRAAEPRQLTRIGEGHIRRQGRGHGYVVLGAFNHIGVYTGFV